MVDLKNLKEYVISCVIAGESTKEKGEDIRCEPLHGLKYDVETNTYYGIETFNVIATSEEEAFDIAADIIVSSEKQLSSSTEKGKYYFFLERIIGDLRKCHCVKFGEYPCSTGDPDDELRCNDSFPLECITVSDIEWDTDGNSAVGLQDEIEIPIDEIELSEDDNYDSFVEYISDYITNETGFCHLGFTIKYDRMFADLFDRYE